MCGVAKIGKRKRSPVFLTLKDMLCYAKALLPAAAMDTKTLIPKAIRESRLEEWRAKVMKKV